MIFREKELGIEAIVWSYYFDDESRHSNDFTPEEEAKLQNMIVHYGMDTKGIATLKTNIPSYNNSFSPNDKMHYIRIADIVLIMDSDKNAEKLFTIVNAILSDREFDKTAQQALADIQELFVF